MNNEDFNQDDVETTEEALVETPEESPFQAMAQAFSKPQGAPTGHYLSALTKDEQETCEAFVAWLKETTTMTTASVSSYKSYLAACMVAFKAGKTRQDLTSSQRSAMNKFVEFLATKS